MKTFKKSLCLMLVVVTIFALSACGSSSSTSSTQKIETSSQAINKVKNYMSGTSFSLEQRIAGALGFNNFYDPQYGTSSATQNSDGSWNVTIKGSMTGYVDEYHDDLESYKFEVSATVSETGSVSISVRKAY